MENNYVILIYIWNYFPQIRKENLKQNENNTTTNLILKNKKKTLRKMRQDIKWICDSTILVCLPNILIEMIHSTFKKHIEDIAK